MRKVFWIFLLLLAISILSLIIIGGGYGTPNDWKVANNGQPIVFSHRGVVLNNCENSTESFQLSKELGFSAIELDVGFTKDKKLVIFHDKSCKRLLGIDIDINNITWKELKGKHLLFNNKETNNTVLLLSDFLKETRYSSILYLDIKEISIPIANELLKVLKHNTSYQSIIIADGNLLFLAYLKLFNKDVQLALEGFNKGKEWLFYVIPKNFKPNYFSSFLFEVDDDHMIFLKENTLVNRKIVYGVDDQNIEEVIEFGLPNVIIDYHESFLSAAEIEKKLSNNKYE